MLYLSCPGNGLGVYNPTNGESTLISYQTPMENQVTLGNDWINDLLCDKDSLIWIAHFLGVRCYDTSKNIFEQINADNKDMFTIVEKIAPYFPLTYCGMC